MSADEQLSLDDEIDDELSFHEWMLSLPGPAPDAIHEDVADLTDRDRSRSREHWPLRRAA